MKKLVFKSLKLMKIVGKINLVNGKRVMEKSGMTYEGVQRKGILLKGKESIEI